MELFVKGDQVWFSEVSPRPHDTGLVTLHSQQLSQFSLHVRAILGLPIPKLPVCSPAASCAVVVQGQGTAVFGNLDDALRVPDSELLLFGKPSVEGRRRLGVSLALGSDIEQARQRARQVAETLTLDWQ